MIDIFFKVLSQIRFLPQGLQQEQGAETEVDSDAGYVGDGG